ncbi:MAG: hypothetical protein Q4D90_10035 [bacterium]|nr:hypothetical protein [bacterium]
MIRCVIIGLLGVAMLAKPDIFWKLECFFRTKSGQPSLWYFRMLRAGGVVFVAAAVLMMLYLQLFS